MWFVRSMKAILILFFLISCKASAAEIFENFQNTRALGMGNAFSSVANDYTSLWYNPAGLDKARGMHLTILGLDAGTDALDIYNVFTQAMGGNFITLIQNFYGRHVWASASDSLAFSMQGLAVAGYDFFNMSLDVHNPAYSNIELSSTNDYGIVLGGALAFIPKIWRVGVAIKRVTRFGGRTSIGPGTLASMNNNTINSLISNQGTGYGADAGMLFTIPAGIRPTFSFVWHDMGQTKFIAASGSNEPPPLENEAVLGMSAVIDGPAFKIRPALDIKHFMQWSEPIGKKVHLGLEFELPAISLRIGANQGYYTAGVGLGLGMFRIDAATYGVELGVYPGHTEDRRYMLNVTMDINFNPFSEDDPDSVNGASGGKSTGRSRGSSIYQRR